MNLPSVRLGVAALWAGSLWTIGYLVAPVLFMRLDRALAGGLAGFMFQAEAWISVVCALFLGGTSLLEQAGEWERRRREFGLIGVMLGCTLLGYFALHPWMAELREAAGAGGIEASPQRSTFAILHGISSFFYLVESLLAMRLVIQIGKR